MTKEKDALDAQRYAWLRDHSGLDLRTLLRVPELTSLESFIDANLSAEQRACPECGEIKSIALFYRDKRGRVLAKCKACQTDATKKWRESRKAGLDTSRKSVGHLPRGEVTRDMVAALLHYDPTTGQFSAKKQRGRIAQAARVGTVSPKGYLRISVYGTIYTAHRLAWLLSYGTWPEQVINHKNGNKLDNRICNLEDIAHEENTRHAHRTGLIRLPGHKTTVKLTPERALEIRASALPKSTLAAQYGVSAATIEDIRAGRTWKNAEHLAAGGVVMTDGTLASGKRRT